MNPGPGGTPLSRRALAVMAAAGTATAVAPAAPARAATAATGLPVLAVDADWAAVLAASPRVQLVPGATYTLSSSVELPDGCRIVGNGATVTVTGDTVGALRATGRHDIALTGIRFLGRAADPPGSAASFAHVGLRLERCTNARVVDCDFSYWRGAGIAVTGSASDDYFAYRCKLRGNSFERCYFGVSIADRSEYSVLVVDGLLPPTFTGNTLWYTDIRASDLAGTGWLLSGCTLSNLTVSCTGTAPVRIVGTQSNGAANAPVLSGRVTDVLAGLG